MRYVLACLKVRRKGLCSRIAIMEARFRNMKKEMKKHLRMSGSSVKEEEEEEYKCYVYNSVAGYIKGKVFFI